MNSNTDSSFAMSNANAMPTLAAAQPAVNHPVHTSKDPYQRMTDFFSASFNNMEKGRKKVRNKTIKFPMKVCNVLFVTRYQQ